MADTNVNVNFGAETYEFLSGIALIEDSLEKISNLVNGLNIQGKDFSKQQRQNTQFISSEYLQVAHDISSAFNRQLRGLLSGTENWSTASRKILGDLIIDFIEQTEKSVLTWVAGEATKTQSTTAGVAQRTSVATQGQAATDTAQSNNIISAIIASAAQTFAGVFGFLAPILGPLASGPAAAARSAVLAVTGQVHKADIGMWSVPQDMLTLVHHNELIMPAAESIAFRNMLTTATSAGENSGNVSITPTTHFHVNAIDGGSVSQWVRSNAPEMMRAIDEAVRHGAHLGLRRV